MGDHLRKTFAKLGAVSRMNAVLRAGSWAAPRPPVAGPAPAAHEGRLQPVLVVHVFKKKGCKK